MTQEIIQQLKGISDQIEQEIANKPASVTGHARRDDLVRRYLAARAKIQDAIAELLKM